MSQVSLSEMINTDKNNVASFLPASVELSAGVLSGLRTEPQTYPRGACGNLHELMVARRPSSDRGKKNSLHTVGRANGGNFQADTGRALYSLTILPPSRGRRGFSC